ncbi:MAG: hypothetical protein ACE362_04345 [Phaeodactylibacter xiamenensis]|uniref:Uncharacterized protein n=1 Tax=Phaeodactylibacter xiamenensis TaxID=1524460 RepID=A0A098S4C4_9BACT|nr:hypothetical protein [Phaeodactylibacter xiamenensis]KGE86052.1 hypothetical protein IX84_23205 [Phaeodactylibacter xiamenensis]MCR9050392.1 hypothetical protein [bacterium]
MAKHHETQPENQQPLAAFAFRRDGSLLCKGKIEDGNTVYFDADSRSLRHSRVFILPEPETGIPLTSLSIERLERRQAFEPRLRFNENGGLIFERIPERIREIWWWRRCCIRGRITNRASVEGQLETYPACNAIVHICEVDRIRWWIDRIDSDLLERLRGDLLERIPIPIPEPPRPLPDPPPFRPEFGLELLQNASSNISVNRMPQAALESPAQLQLLHQQIQRVDAVQFRNILADHFAHFFPYFCTFPYLWPWLYRCDEVAVVETDQNGRFEACIWHQGDQPDVYVWLEYPLDGGNVTVHRPRVPCATYWDYDCGEDINIQLSDSRIPPVCGGILEGTSVAIRSIGTHVSPLHIDQRLTNTITLPGDGNFRTVGLTSYATQGLGSYSPQLTNQFVRPFTGNIPIYAQFGEGLPATNIHYFQVQYRRTHNAGLLTLINPSDLNSGWKTLESGALNRRYVLQDGLDFKYEYYNLGPFEVNGARVYRIPPLDPKLPGIDGQPASSDPTARWSRYDSVAIARINTNLLEEDGLYEFRVRFLDQNGDLANVNPYFFRVPDPEDVNATMAAPNLYIRQIGADAVFQFRMRVDNLRPALGIFGVSLDGDFSAMTDCGFLAYQSVSQQVGLSFRASHPRGFGLFNFNVERGRRNSLFNHFTLGDARGVVTGSKAPYTLGPDGIYRASFSIAALLAGCGDKAAFSESLTAVGLHTDGTHAGNFYRNTVSNAFAIAPQ